MKPGSLGEPHIAALIGSSIGSITGLFAIGIAPAILEQNARLMIAHPTIGLLCFVVGGVVGWIAGGLLGSTLGRTRGFQQGYITGGVIGGTLPFAAFVLLGWLLWTQ
ncbi:MAG: hypothetical protein MUE94_08885 [Verrucomicrobia bacterium]|jgi:hypothetical protein|nr:hypothetical protein [Verrucomicrobiota bacterium]